MTSIGSVYLKILGLLSLQRASLKPRVFLRFNSETMLAAYLACRNQPSTNGSMGFFVLSAMRICGELPKDL